MKINNLESFIDHTVLSPDSKLADIEKACREAEKHGFFGVCINPYFVRYVSKRFANYQDLKTISVIGFPLGANLTQVKIEETEYSLEYGADEIDMVANISMIKDGDWNELKREIQQIATLTSSNNAQLKVIIETGYLIDEEKKEAAKTCLEAGANFIKTCTGFGPGQATPEDVSLLSSIVGNRLKVKASGKIRNYEQAAKLIQAGAARLGASKSVQIIEEKNSHH